MDMHRRMNAMQWATDLRHEARRLAEERLAKKELAEEEAKRQKKSKTTKTRPAPKVRRRLRRKQDAKNPYTKKLGPVRKRKLDQKTKKIYARLVDEYVANKLQGLTLGPGIIGDIFCCTARRTNGSPSSC
jgi:hypothetical protein